MKVADAITARYKSIDGGDAPFFDQRRIDFASALQPYDARIVEIKQKFAGVKIGATESIFVYMAAALKLDLISPVEFMDAVAEGNDPPASAVVEFQNQITARQVKVLVYNVQTATAVTTNVKHLAQAADIPVVGVSETLQPETVAFQDWVSGAALLGGRLASLADLRTHLTTLFPPVRLRGFLEIRYLNMNPPRWWPARPWPACSCRPSRICARPRRAARGRAARGCAGRRCWRFSCPGSCRATSAASCRHRGSGSWRRRRSRARRA